MSKHRYSDIAGPLTIHTQSRLLERYLHIPRHHKSKPRKEITFQIFDVLYSAVLLEFYLKKKKRLKTIVLPTIPCWLGYVAWAIGVVLILSLEILWMYPRLS